MTPPASLESDFLYMFRNIVQTDSQSSCSHSGYDDTLVRIFSANSSGKLNLRQPGVDTTIGYSQELSRLSEEDLESDVVFWIDAGYVRDHSPFPVPFRTYCSILTIDLVVHFDVLQDWKQTRPTDARGRSLEILMACCSRLRHHLVFL